MTVWERRQEGFREKRSGRCRRREKGGNTGRKRVPGGGGQIRVEERKGKRVELQIKSG